MKVIHTLKKDEKITTNFETSNDEDVINKSSLDKKLSKLEALLSNLETVNNEFKILSNKQSVEEVLVPRAVETTFQILYDKGLFDNFPNAVKVLKGFLFFT